MSTSPRLPSVMTAPANPSPVPDWTGHPVWGLGFRPFFLLGAGAAAVLVLLWLAVLNGIVPPPAIDPVTWHAHEMIYGFAVAIVTGFVLTASQNWTGRRGVHGRRLQGLAALWVLGRAAMWAYPQPRYLPAAIDLALIPWLALLLVPYLTAPSQRRNAVLFLPLGLLLAGNILVHADLLALWPGAARQGLWLGVYCLLFLITLIGGRVIPFFSRSVLPGARIRVRRWVEALSVATLVALVLAVFLPPEHLFARGAAAAAAIVHTIRWAGWFTPAVLRRPILWILYAGYAWLVAGFALLAFLPGIGQPPSLAIHAFTVGGIGVVIYGMVSRIALGHTGRPIEAAPAILVGYVAMNAAVLARVVWPLLDPGSYNLAMLTAGALWVLAFTIMLAHYAPMLWRPRGSP